MTRSSPMVMIDLSALEATQGSRAALDGALQLMGVRPASYTSADGGGVLVQVSGVQFFHGGQKLEIAPRRARTEALAASRMLNTLRLTAEEGMHLVVPSTGKRFGIDLSR